MQHFLTTSPDVLSFFKNKKQKVFLYQIQVINSFETLNNFKKSCNVDVFFALSHGVHRGVLKSGKIDDRIIFLNKLKK